MNYFTHFGKYLLMLKGMFTATENKMMFCGQFTDGQRASAMQMASTQDATGMTMSPDEAVQKVSGASGANPQMKTPTGCPVK